MAVARPSGVGRAREDETLANCLAGEEYFPLDHADYGETIERIMSSGTEIVFNTIVPPGLTPFLQQLFDAGFPKRGRQNLLPLFDENFLQLVPA